MTNRLRCLRVRPPPSSTLLYLSWQELRLLALCLLCSASLPCSLSPFLASLACPAWSLSALLCISSLASVLLVPSLFYALPLLLAHFSASLPCYMSPLPYAYLDCSVSLTSSVSLPCLHYLLCLLPLFFSVNCCFLVALLSVNCLFVFCCCFQYNGRSLFGPSL